MSSERCQSFFLSLLLLSSLSSLDKAAWAQSDAPPQPNLEITPELGTVPGIYYDPSGELSPSISEMGGASEGGVISFDLEDFDDKYNVQRLWKKGATPEQIIKVGDVQNNPTLNKLLDLENLTLSEIAASGGADIDSVPVKSVGLLNNMTVSEFFQVFPELNNQPIKDVPLFGQISGTPQNLESVVLTPAQSSLISELAENPVFENIPVSELVTGDWSGILNGTAQQELQDLVGNYPELNNLPADKLLPIFEGIISGDGNSLLSKTSAVIWEQGEEILTEELLEAVPELGDTPLGALPIDDLLVGDIEGLADQTLDSIPDLADKYLADLANFSQIPGNFLLGDVTMLLLTGDLFGRLDIAYAGETENPVTHVLTGGTRHQKFKPEPCFETSCKHFEITDLLSGATDVGNLQGKAWVQGSSQSVPGGQGFLRFVNGGKERTGVSVWSTGSHVKLSLENIEEGGDGEPATARIWLDFQICISVPFLGEQCTPHSFSFPTPWKVQEGGLMLVSSRSGAPEVIDKIGDLAREGNGTIGSSPNSPQPLMPCVPTESNNCEQGNGIPTGTLKNPAPGYPITSGFGRRKSPCPGCSSFHPAVDIGTPANTPIQSADGGTVTGAEWVKGYGYTVVIAHANGVKTRYSHLNQINVKPGQKVSKGQVIALSGATGYGTGPHLDFGVYVHQGASWWPTKSTAIDPQTVIDFSR